ncbi:MAG: ankyrin repeat domain-containing protein [Lentisphaeria bacterium]
MKKQGAKRWIIGVSILVVFVAIRFTGPVDDQISYAASSAAYSGDMLKLRITRLLGVDINRPVSGRGPLIVSAAWNGQLKVIRYLLDAGVDVETKDKFGGTSLSRSAQGGQIETVRMLIHAGANVNVKDLEGGNTPIDLCRMNARRYGFDPEPIIALIASRGGKANTTNKNESQ